MKLTSLSIKNPVGTVLIIISVVLLGLITIPNLPVSFWPEFVAPSLIVVAPYPGVGPEEIEESVAKPLEEELATIDGIDDIETTCLEGACRIIVRFDWGVKFEDAKRDVQDRTAKARSRMPREVLEPTVLQIQDFIPPGIELGFESDSRNLEAIRDWVENKAVNRFLRLQDVASAQVFGGYEQHVAVKIDPNRLAAHGISISQINTTLLTDNINVPAGKIELGDKSYIIRTVGKYQEVEDIRNAIIAAPNGQPIYLKDIAEVSLENKDRTSITRLNNKEIVGLSIREKSGGNTVAMCDQVKAELRDFQSIVPMDIRISVIRDQSLFIKSAIRSVVNNAMVGAVLASIILLLFLGNLRNTLIIALSIPISIIGTFILINAFGLSINTISLGGLALGVGMIVDASVVVMENIYRHLQEKKSQNRFDAVVSAANEVGLAITSSTLTSIVVFLPMVFLVGLFAVLLGELALTVVFSLSLSILVALTIVPLLSYKLMRVEAGTSPFAAVTRAWQRFFNAILNTYEPTLRWVLRHRLLTMLAAVLVLVFSVGFIAPRLDVVMLPSTNEGEFRLDLTLPVGTTLSMTDEIVQKIERDLTSRPDIEKVYTVVGRTAGLGDVQSHVANLSVQVKKQNLPQLAEIMQRTRKHWSQIPGARLIIKQTTATEGMQREPVNARIVGDDLAVLEMIGSEVLDRLQKIPGVVNLNSSMQEGLAEFGIQIDRVKASDLGLATSQIATAVRQAVLGVSNTKLSSFGDEYDITAMIDDARIRSVNDLLDLPLTTTKGQIVPLRAVADISLERGPSEIKRFDQQRVVEVKADVAGRSQRQVNAAVRAEMARLSLPPDYFIDYGGQSKAIVDSFRSLLTALAIAFFLVYVVMGAQFNSFRHPFIILFTVPLALIGVFFGLWIFGAALSMNALLGMIMLVGIVVNNGILLIDYTNQLRDRGMEKYAAIVQGGVTRLRPILITSLTTIFGMLPIALGLGEGGESLQPLGAVVVGGLATSTLLTLVVIPVVYSFFVRKASV